MSRASDPQWQRLRRDKRSGFATFLTVIAWVPTIVGIVMLSAPDTQAEARGNPLYWLLFVPFAWWGASLTRYEARPLRFIRPAQILAPLLSAGIAIVAAMGGDDAGPFVIATVLSAICAGAAWFLYTNSMLQREGRD